MEWSAQSESTAEVDGIVSYYPVFVKGGGVGKEGGMSDPRKRRHRTRRKTSMKYRATNLNGLKATIEGSTKGSRVVISGRMQVHHPACLNLKQSVCSISVESSACSAALEDRPT